jgi:hypothetical protein
MRSKEAFAYSRGTGYFCFATDHPAPCPVFCGGLSDPFGRAAMHDFIKRFAGGVFFPEEVEILVAAFDDAWAQLQASRAPFAEDPYDARETLAKHIIMSAQRGERNRRQLTYDALLHLSEQLSGGPV